MFQSVVRATIDVLLSVCQTVGKISLTVGTRTVLGGMLSGNCLGDVSRRELPVTTWHCAWL